MEIINYYFMIYIFYWFIFTASSNLHREDVLCHYDNDSSSDEGSEFSTDQISLHEKSLTSRISAHYLSTLREVRTALKNQDFPCIQSRKLKIMQDIYCTNFRLTKQ